MYERFYGLRELPFELTPNPRYLFLTASHREALSNLRYGIDGRRGVTLLTGDPGTGKTTLVQSVLESEQRQGKRCVYLNNPTLTRSEFVEFLAAAFELSNRASVSKVALLRELERVLVERRAQGVTTALLIDEAQVLPLELLEEIRLLANIETATDKLLSIVLSGQPQLTDRLNHPDLKQLKQRVALRCHLRPLDLDETAAYIVRRVQIAGGNGTALFTRDAVELIHDCSQGIPRTISVICHNALMSGFAMDRRPVARSLVHEICTDFDLDPPPLPYADPEPVEAVAAAHPPAATPAVRHELVPEAAAIAGRSMFRFFGPRKRFSLF